MIERRFIFSIENVVFNFEITLFYFTVYAEGYNRVIVVLVYFETFISVKIN